MKSAGRSNLIERMKLFDYEFKKALSLKVAGWLLSEGKPNDRKKIFSRVIQNKPFNRADI